MQKTTFQYMSKWHQTKVSTERASYRPLIENTQNRGGAVC